MEYRIDDKMLNTSVFLTFVNQVWPGDYDIEKTKNALSKTLNITAYDGKRFAVLYDREKIILKQKAAVAGTSILNLDLNDHLEQGFKNSGLLDHLYQRAICPELSQLRILQIAVN